MDELSVALQFEKVDWVLDADIKGFFGAPRGAVRFQPVLLVSGERAR